MKRSTDSSTEQLISVFDYEYADPNFMYCDSGGSTGPHCIDGKIVNIESNYKISGGVLGVNRFLIKDTNLSYNQKYKVEKVVLESIARSVEIVVEDQIGFGKYLCVEQRELICDLHERLNGKVLVEGRNIYLKVGNSAWLVSRCVKLEPANSVLASSTVVSISADKYSHTTINNESNAAEGVVERMKEVCSNSVGGLDALVDGIFTGAILPRLMPSGIVSDTGIEFVKGVILHGPPGTGKTLLARNIYEILGDKLCHKPVIINGPELLNCLVGNSESNIRDVFKPARQEFELSGDKSRLHIVVFDELDALFSKRSSETKVQTVSQLLTELDGSSRLNNLLVFGLTNRLEILDPALLRPGRFELVYKVSKPSLEARKCIITIHTKKIQKYICDTVDLENVACITDGCSGAELAGIVRYALSSAMRRVFDSGNKDVLQVSQHDFDDAINQITNLQQ